MGLIDKYSARRPYLRFGDVVCAPCGGKPIEFGDYAENSAGGDWQVIVAQCPIHGNAALRASWDDIARHKGPILAFSEAVADLPGAPPQLDTTKPAPACDTKAP